MIRLTRKLKNYFLTHPILSSLLLFLSLVLVTLAGSYLWGDYYLSLARKAIRQEKFTLAVQYLEEAEPVQFWNSDFYLLLSRTQRQSGNLSAAEAAIQKSIKIKGQTDERDQLEMILVRCMRGELQDVESGIKNCIYNNHPDRSHILETLVEAYVNERNYQEAMNAVEMWSNFEPNSAKPVLHRGIVFEKMDQMDRALAEYLKALEMDPHYVVARIQVIAIYFDRNRIDLAKEQLKKVSEDDPERNEVLYSGARIAFLEGELNEARKYLDSLLKKNPDYAPALFLRGELEYQDSQFDQAVYWLKKAIENTPTVPQAHYQLARSYTQLVGFEKEAEYHSKRHIFLRDKMVEANDIIRKKLGQNPRDLEAVADVVKIFFECEMNHDALSWANRGLQFEPGHRKIRTLLAEYYEKIGEPRIADLQRNSIHSGQVPKN